MAKRKRKTQVVGGFDALKAAQRASEPRFRSSAQPGGAADAPPASPAGPTKIASRIDHTALPTKHEIRCYECGFEFQLAGRTPTTHCPKCRKQLEIKTYTIEGEWSEPVRTAGTIRVESGAVITAGELVATDIVLNGRLEGGTLQAYRWLEIGPAAQFAEKDLAARDLRIAAGAEVRFRSKRACHNAEIQGALRARLTATGLVRVRPGGVLRGELVGSRLAVDEGGGLEARVRVERPVPEAGAEAAA